MANKRKRSNAMPHEDAPSTGRATKKAKGDNNAAKHGETIVHPLLSLLYPHIQTLRDYVLSRLPTSSRLRRKKIASVGFQNESTGKPVTEIELAVAHLLDTTVVACSSSQPESRSDDNRWEKWVSFSQKGDESYVTLSDGFTGASFSQTEVCATIQN
jgi:telomerase reverse transcriptase